MVDEAAAVGHQIRRPPECVHHFAGLMRCLFLVGRGRRPRRPAPRGQLDQFLDRERVRLGLRALQSLRGDQLVREDASAPFGEHHDACADFLGGEIVGLRLARLVHALRARAGADDAAVLLHEFGDGVARHHGGAFLLGDLREVRGDLGKRPDGISLAAHHRRHPRDLHGKSGRHDRAEALARHARLHGQFRELFGREQFPQIAVVDDRARKHVAAGVPALVQHQHAHVLVLAAQRDRRREPRGARPHHQHIRLDHGHDSVIRDKTNSICRGHETDAAETTPKGRSSLYALSIVTAHQTFKG